MVKKIVKHKVLIIILILVGLVAGTAYYFLPSRYAATGTLFVKRSADASTSNYFIYEGYYSQQTALSFTSTTMALLGSIDVRSRSLTKLGLPVSESNLRKYSRLIRVSKLGPQLVTLTTVGNSTGDAEALWKAVADTTILTARQLNVGGDPLLSISKVSLQPVVKVEYKPLWLCMSVGGLAFFVLAIFLVSTKEYFGWR